MNRLADVRIVGQLAGEQGGVFSKADLQNAFAEPHPAAFVHRIRYLVDNGILRRFSRGWYVSESFDLATLSQRIAPDSYISFGTVLARHLVIGTNPSSQVIAVKVGRSRSYAALGFSIEHVGISSHLFFGYSSVDGIRYADAEKAVLDTLYFHLRGRRYPFDIYSDINLGKLDQTRLREYLNRYRNPKFVAFAESTLEL
jgi:hypothetical protein